jgi:hypothetical protein
VNRLFTVAPSFGSAKKTRGLPPGSAGFAVSVVVVAGADAGGAGSGAARHHGDGQRHQREGI